MDSFSDIVCRSPLRYTLLELTTASFVELIVPRSLISVSEKECVGVMRGVREQCVLSVSASLCMCI